MKHYDPCEDPCERKICASCGELIEEYIDSVGDLVQWCDDCRRAGTGICPPDCPYLREVNT